MIAILIAVLCAAVFFVSVNTALLRFTRFRLAMLAAAVVPGVALALACAGLGDLLVRRGAREAELCLTERLLFAFACGLGLMSCGAAAVGFAGVLNQMSSLALVGVGLIVGLPLWRELLTAGGNAERESRPRVARTTTLLITLVAIAIVMIGVFALTPPVLFDVTEYHLGAWTDYARGDGAARFVSISHNFYARFPFPIESLYFVGLALSPAIDSAPKLLNAISVVACAALAAAMVRRCAIGTGGRWLAALAVLTLPVMLDISIDAMIDAPVALLVAGSIYAAWIAAGKFTVSAGPAASMVIPALFLFGSAIAAKYTVAQVYLLPWCMVTLPAVFVAVRRRPVLLIGAVVLAALPVVVWLGKNVMLYGNPLEPFFVKWFRPEDAGAIAREKFYIESHFPQSPLSGAYWTSLLPRLQEFTWLYLVACAGWYFRGDRRILLKIALFCGAAFLLWNLVRESQDRFLLPAMMLVTAAAVVGICSIPSRAYRRPAAGAAVLFCAMQMMGYGLKLKESAAIDYLLDFYPDSAETAALPDEKTARQIFVEKNLGDLGRIITSIEKAVPPDAKILMIYEARPYLFRHQTDYNVVWDPSVLLNLLRNVGSVDDAWQKLREAGYSHVLVNRQELLRYIQQYARKSQLLRLGVRPGEDPRAAWSATAHPEDLYPPFYLDRDWERLRPLVHEFLADADKRAELREGLAASSPRAKGLDIFVAPMP